MVGVEDRGGVAREVVRPHVMGLWRKIRMERQHFQECIKWKMGRGNKILFWMDEWIGSWCLKDQFLSIFVIAQSKNMVVDEAYAMVNERPEWLVTD